MKKNTPHKKFIEGRGCVKNYSPSPQNPFEGNGVEFEKFTIKN